MKDGHIVSSNYLYFLRTCSCPYKQIKGNISYIIFYLSPVSTESKQKTGSYGHTITH